MPVISSELLDDPLLVAGALSFSGGVDMNSDPVTIRPDQLVEAVNMDIDRNGFITTRGGTSLAHYAYVVSNNIQLLTTYTDTTGTPWLVWMTGGKMRRADGFLYSINNNNLALEPSLISGVTSSNTHGFTSAKQVCSAQIGATLYLCDGGSTSPLRFYQFNPSNPTTYSTGNGQANDSLGTKFNVRSSSGSYTTGFPTNAGFYLLCAHAGRVFGVRSSQPDLLYYSKTLPDYNSSDSWLEAANIKIGTDGLPITALASWTGTRLVVYKENSCFILDADPLAAVGANLAETGAKWSLERVSSEVGCVASRSVVQVGANLYWLARDGVRTMSRTLSGSENEISEPISKPVLNEIKNINPSEAKYAAAAYYKNRYFLSFASGSSDRNNRTLVYNVLNQAWSGVWTNYFCAEAFASYTPRKSGRGNLLYLGQALPKGVGVGTQSANSRICALLRWIDDPSTYSGNAYRDFDLSADYSWKLGQNFGFIPDNSERLDVLNLTPTAAGSTIPSGLSAFFRNPSDTSLEYVDHRDSFSNILRAGATRYEIFDAGLNRAVYASTNLSSASLGWRAINADGSDNPNIPPPYVTRTFQFPNIFYPSIFQTKQFDFDIPLSFKTINNVEVFFGSSQAKASLSIVDSDDNEAYVFRNSDTSSAGSGSYLPTLGRDSIVVDGEAQFGLLLPFSLFKPTAKRIAKSVLNVSNSNAYSIRLEAGEGKLDVRKALITGFEDAYRPETA